MTRGKKLLLLLAVLVVLCAAALVISRLDLEQADVQEDDSVTLLTLDPDTVTQLSWTYQGETVTLTLSEDGWIDADGSGQEIDQDTVSAMLTALSDVTAQKTIESPDDLAQYGLEEPTCTISAQGDVSAQLVIGDATSIGSTRYLSVGDGNVYLVNTSLLTSFSYSLPDLAPEDETSEEETSEEETSEEETLEEETSEESSEEAAES
jgi:hypothetical protein